MKFENYRSFDNIATARALLLNMLDEQGIPYQLYKDGYRQDVILGKGLNFTEVWVKLRPQDFATVNDILRRDAEERIQAVPDDYYLRELNTKELLDILTAPDAWSIDDYVIARKLLAEAGIAITDEELKRLQRERFEQLKQEKRSQADELLSPYNLLERGNYLQNASVVNPDTGQREHVFNDKERSTGKVLTILGFVIFIVFLLWRFYWDGPLW